jgi:high affinity Mn2+ porin
MTRFLSVLALLVGLSLCAASRLNADEPSGGAAPALARGPVPPPFAVALGTGTQAQSARYTIHFQATVIDEGDARFHAPYTNINGAAHSLPPNPQDAASITSTLFMGLRLLPGTELYLNPEIAGGRGIGSVYGVAGFPNGEIYRVGDPQPTISTARLYLRQTFGFGGEMEKVEDGPNQIAETVATRRLILTAGKFSLPDNFDCNAYSHDPRSQFLNWSLMSSGAWDYPADTRGYTWGGIAEYHAPDWALRGAAVAEPKVANELQMDQRIGLAHGLVMEGEHAVHVGESKGTGRLTAFYNQADMGNYDEAIAQAQATGQTPDVTQSRSYAHNKWGVASSDDLQLTELLGAFSRLSWNDGRSETWAFAEIDSSQAFGLDFKAATWGRPQDGLGVAEVVNELSGPHRRYLAAGGMGFMLGDGALHYGPEMITETYYRWQVVDHLAVTPDAQLVVNPGYNRSRGPVPIWSLRVHAEF